MLCLLVKGFCTESKQGRTLVVSWLPGNPLKPQSGRGSLLTAHTNNVCTSVALRHYTENKLLSSSELRRTRSQWRQELGSLASQFVIPLSEANTIAAIHM